MDFRVRDRCALDSRRLSGILGGGGRRPNVDRRALVKVGGPGAKRKLGAEKRAFVLERWRQVGAGGFFVFKKSGAVQKKRPSVLSALDQN